MSLLKKASIITTPTAYAEDYLYSIKPAIPFGDELIVNGNFATDSNWTKETGWSISGGKAVKVAGTAGAIRQNTIPTAVIGKQYKLSFDAVVTAGVGNSTLYGATTTPNFSTTGSYEYIITATSTTNFNIYVTSTFVGSIDNVSVKELTDADFDFDRNSTGTRVNEDYLIEDVPYNLAKYSQDLSGGAWSNTNSTESLDTSVLAPDGTATAWKLQASAATGFSFILQAITMTGQNTFSCFLKKGTSSTASMFFSESGNFGLSVNLDTGTITNTSGSDMTSSVESAGNGWYRFHISHTSGDDLVNQIRIGVADGAIASATYAGTENIYVWGAQVTKGGIKPYLKTTDRLDIPRIDYTNGEPSILLEPSRTNLITYSEDLSQLTNQNITINSNSVISPEGIMNATRVVPTTNSSQHRFTPNTTVSTSTVYTASIFAKADGYNRIKLVENATTGGNAGFDLQNGTILTTSGVTAKIEAFPNNWYRCSITETTASTSFRFDVIIMDDSSNSTFAGDGTSGVQLYGYQLEQGSYATSLIHTSGSAVTRSADAANNAANSDLISSTEGVLYAEIKALADDLTFRAIALSDGTFDNRVLIRYRNSSDNINVLIEANNVSILNQLYQMIDITNYSKIAFRYKSGDISLYVDGQEVFSSTTTFSSLSLDRLNLDGGTGADDFYANVKSVMVFKEALTDLELACLTGYNNHELYMNYYNRLSYLGLVEEYNVESDINNYIL